MTTCRSFVAIFREACSWKASFALTRCIWGNGHESEQAKCWCKPAYDTKLRPSHCSNDIWFSLEAPILKKCASCCGCSIYFGIVGCLPNSSWLLIWASLPLRRLAPPLPGATPPAAWGGGEREAGEGEEGRGGAGLQSPLPARSLWRRGAAGNAAATPFAAERPPPRLALTPPLPPPTAPRSPFPVRSAITGGVAACRCRGG